MARRSKKQKGKKRVNYELIRPDHIVGEPIYRLMNELIEKHHDHLKDARIGLAWCTAWKPDRDGRVTLGKCIKVSDLDREFAGFDFKIVLNRNFWDNPDIKPEQRTALVDHELSHAGGVYDDRTGEPVLDERGRKAWRIIKHDLEEFSGVVERNGIYKSDIANFYASLNRAARMPWVPCATCQESDSPGWVTLPTGAVKQCVCRTNWLARHAEAIAS